MPTSDTARIVYRGKPSLFLFALVAVPLGLVAAFALRMAWAGIVQLGDYGMGGGAAGFAALILYMIVSVGWFTFGPSMILTPTQILKPGPFRTRRIAISPETPMIRWDSRRRMSSEAAVVDRTANIGTVETSMILMPGRGDRPALVASSAHDGAHVKAVTQDLKRIAGIDVRHLTPDGPSPDRAPPPSRWPKL